MINPRSIRFRLTLWYASWLIGAFLVFGVSMHAILDHYLQRSLQDTLSRRSHQIETLLQSPPAADRKWLIDEITARYTPELNGRFIRITDNGELIYRSQEPKDQSFNPENIPLIDNPPKRERLRRMTLPDGAELLINALPGKGGSLVEVGSTRSSIQSVLHQFAQTLSVGLPLMLIASLAGGYLLVGRVLRPVDKITRSAEEITLHNLSDRLPVTKSGDEIERLSVALNGMIRRLDESFDYTRRFITDASHELRTPLTIMRGELEGLVQRPGLTSETRDALGSTLEEVERLSRIVEGLFALSRLDAREAAEVVTFDLGKLAETTADQMCLLAEDKHIAICCQVSGEVLVQGDRARLKQVIVNLLDNAIKYTIEGGNVAAKVSVHNGRACLEVSDNGIGIPANALPHIFERFFRVDQARSRQQGGAGLGLSIVKAIVTSHNGTVEVDSKENVGSKFTVSLPIVNSNSTK